MDQVQEVQDVQETDVSETVDERTIQEAKALGWADRDAWKGDPDRWVSAKDFLEKAEHITPILRENNKRLLSEVGSYKSQMAQMQAQLRNTEAALKALEEFREETVVERTADEKAELKTQLAEASRDGDYERVAELTEKLVELGARQAGKGTVKKETEESTGSSKLPPDVQAWFVSNPTYLTDARRRALSDAVALELRQNGETSTGPAFLDKVAAEVEKTLGGSTARQNPGKAASGNGGTGRSNQRASGEKSFADLPSDAREACDSLAKRFVGEGKKFKDQASWRASYTKEYFRQQEKE